MVRTLPSIIMACIPPVVDRTGDEATALGKVGCTWNFEAAPRGSSR